VAVAVPVAGQQQLVLVAVSVAGRQQLDLVAVPVHACSSSS
jgi:hypothetical protein